MTKTLLLVGLLILSTPALAINDQKQNVCTCNCSTAPALTAYPTGYPTGYPQISTPELLVNTGQQCSVWEKKLSKERQINECLMFTNPDEKVQCLEKLKNSL